MTVKKPRKKVSRYAKEVIKTTSWCCDAKISESKFCTECGEGQ